jgi:hypothetical protein
MASSVRERRFRYVPRLRCRAHDHIFSATFLRKSVQADAKRRRRGVSSAPYSQRLRNQRNSAPRPNRISRPVPSTTRPPTQLVLRPKVRRFVPRPATRLNERDSGGPSWTLSFARVSRRPEIRSRPGPSLALANSPASALAIGVGADVSERPPSPASCYSSRRRTEKRRRYAVGVVP